MNFNVNDLVRENVKQLVPYSSARDEFSGEAKIFLDANENSLGSPTTKWYNRYPDPHQLKIKEKLSAIKGVPAKNIFLGNGSDECIDILFRAFCNPGKDNVIICPPTYGMYEVSAHINDVELRKVPLLENFQLDLVHMETRVDDFTKLIWLCSPNNPTANSLHREDVETVLNNFPGIVVIDEAYINFSRHRSFVQELAEYPNLVVLHTLSKAWGLAGLRLGMAFAGEAIIAVCNKIKPPYNIGQATQDLVLKALDQVEDVNEMIRILVKERDRMAAQLLSVGVVEQVYPSDANFLLVKVRDAKAVYRALLDKGIVVRDRSNVQLCEGCLRITVGSPAENEALLNSLKSFSAAL
ncbi:histidinol-phosphate transaminase [Agriterribacter sp.]|uniref:histidinol-phosphate transaminase n=1 Tax=Agriterribacter sp. TaxID=2821509 RepID=UPI002CC69D52|nr:histidinol-phosphate transaminase [Agriterribacter sp.]HRO44216.1 histidinol-phosphate transaminase [Agriterribacter sp.]HRQ19056.1 histidinol-phosphate transaminase [Agriterribacter sp.]